MDFHTIINLIYTAVCCVNFCVASAFLTMALLYRRRCGNFSTLLACNTALGVLLYSIVHIFQSIYMYTWDRSEVVDIDSLCSARAYLHHSIAACIHHSFLLQAIQRFCTIRRLPFLKNQRRKILLVLFQWISDFAVPLPAFVTGNMGKLSSENVCFVTMTKFYFSLYMAGWAFLLTDVSLTVIYRSLVRHVREVSARLDRNQQNQIERDLTMVRRIVLLNSQLLLTGIPVLVVIILMLVRADLLPNKFMRIPILMANAPMSPLLIILFWLTPDLRHSFIACRNKWRHRLYPGKVIPVRGIQTETHF